MIIYKQEEWQDATGYWHSNCVSNLSEGSSAWHLPARILGVTPEQFLTLLFEKYKPDRFFFDKEKCLCFWSWKDQQVMRKYKNFINAEARKRNFLI